MGPLVTVSCGKKMSRRERGAGGEGGGGGT